MCRVLSDLVVSVNVCHSGGLKIRIEIYRVVAHVNLQVTVHGACGYNPRLLPVSALCCSKFGGALVQNSYLESERKECRFSECVITSVSGT